MAYQYGITYMQNLKYDTNEPIYKTETDSETWKSRLVVAEGEEWTGSLRVSRCKLLHLEWINSKVLLHSTGNYIQCPVINHTRKEYEKRMYYFSKQQKLIQYY